jgi:O-antigen/teichoic acid export membrane protein
LESPAAIFREVWLYTFAARWQIQEGKSIISLVNPSWYHMDLNTTQPLTKSDTRTITGSFFSSLATLAGGATIAYGLTVLASPISSRLFDPQAFGMATLFTSAAGMMGMVATLRYEMALVLPKKEEDAMRLFCLCCVVLLAMSLAMFFLVFFFGAHLLYWGNAEELEPFLLLFPVYVFLVGLERLIQFWNTRHKNFDLVALGRILVTAPTAGAEIAGGLAGFTSAGSLVVFRTISYILAPFWLLWKFFSNDLSAFIREGLAGGLWRASRRYKKFPLFDSWATFINSMSWNMPLILMPAFFGPSEAGLFAKALYLLYLPVLLIGQSVGQVLLQSAAEIRGDEDELRKLIQGLFQRMISFATLPLTLVALIGPDIFAVFLGNWWTASGIYAKIICPWLLMLLLFSSIRTLYQVLERQGIGLALNLVLFGLRLAALVLGAAMFHDPYLTVLLMTLVSTLVFVFQCHFLLAAVGLSFTQPALHFFRMLIFALPTLTFTGCAKWVFDFSPVFVLAVAISSSFFYAFLVIRHDRQLGSLVSRAFPKHDSPG